MAPDWKSLLVAPVVPVPWVYELRLRSVAYGTEQIAFYYETVELFPILKAWLQYHACTDITQDGPYMLPWAEKLLAQRATTTYADDFEARCLPGGPPRLRE